MSRSLNLEISKFMKRHVVYDWEIWSLHALDQNDRKVAKSENSCFMSFISAPISFISFR